MFADFHFVDMPFVRCKSKLPYCCRLRDAIKANMKVTDGDFELQCWFSNKLFTKMCLVRGGTHWTRALKLIFCKRMAVCNPIFKRWHNIELLTAPPNIHYRHFVSEQVL